MTWLSRRARAGGADYRQLRGAAAVDGEFAAATAGLGAIFDHVLAEAAAGANSTMGSEQVRRLMPGPFTRAATSQGSVTLRTSDGSGLRLLCAHNEDAEQVYAMVVLEGVHISASLATTDGPTLVVTSRSWQRYVQLRSVTVLP